jgi:mono/diheme cytochrome c family protein
MERNVMQTSKLLRLLSTLTLAGFLSAFGTASAYGQYRVFTQNRDNIKIDASGLPTDVQKDYQVFRDKCNQCHGLDTSLKPSMSSAQWSFEVKRMQNMPSSHFNDMEAKAIVNFLNYDEAHRKSVAKASPQAAAVGPTSAGRQFYDAQGCEACHAIAGKGGSGGPDLTNVGSRLDRNRLTQLLEDLRSGKSDKMPPLPAETTDQQIKSLVDYLTTLKGS